MDYSRYASSGKYYTGAERKKGILIDGEAYIVKYAKMSPEGMTYSHVSEYIGSHLFAHLGIETQQTMLGTCDNQQVVVMKDFIEKNEMFVPFNDVGDSSLEREKEKYQYSYEDIISMLKENTKLTNVKDTCERFWDMYIVDAWIGNFDRHGANWGFIKKDNAYRIAPVYDNGSSLFPKLNTDEKIQEILNSEDEMNKRIFTFPTSQILLNGKKSSYYDVISSLKFEECNNALVRICNKIDMNLVIEFISNMNEISMVRKEFYITMLRRRYEKILLEPFMRLERSKYGKDICV